MPSRSGSISQRAMVAKARPVGAVNLDVVRRALRGPRPGLRAQIQMMPRPRAPNVTWQPARHGGVLLLLYPMDGTLYLVLTRRTETLPNHKGQIAFPGGAREPGESFAETALREAWEELGLDSMRVEILGHLTPLYIPSSNYCIHPVVGHTPARPTFHPASHEVAAILETPVRILLNPATVREEDRPLRGMSVRVPFYSIQGEKVWGATAMVLAEFVQMLRCAMNSAL